MYGYVVPLKSSLKKQDFVLYRAFYCGLCCQTGKLFGQLPRFTTNYEFTFLSALLHDVSAADILIEEHGCVLNPKKKAMLMPGPLSERIAATNILLSYQKAQDGVDDGDGLKYVAARRMLKKAFSKAKTICPEAWEVIERSYAEQRKAEEAQVSSIDRAAHPFSQMLSSLPAAITGGKTDDKTAAMCYNIGKFVYIADAIDDLEEDARHKRYNPFLLLHGGFTDRKSFLAAHDDIKFCLMSAYSRAVENFNAIVFTQSYSLLSNIVREGLYAKAEELLSSEKKLRAPRI